MLKEVYIALVCLFLSISIYSQTYTLGPGISGTTINTCSGTFYDSGGPSGDYSDDENYSVTLCSNESNQIRLDFTSWNVENQASCSFDVMNIYDGSNSSDPLIGSYCTSSPVLVTSTDQCLHIVFTSDGSVVESGWEATISCVSLSCETYADEFSSSTYNNSNGTLSWSSEFWTEMDDNGNPATGDVYISGGTLQLNNSNGYNSGATPSIERSVNLENADFASISFDYFENAGFESTDIFQFAVFDGSTWTVLLEEVDDFGSQSATLDISAYANANTRIRFEITSFFGATNEILNVDNLVVTYCINDVVENVDTDFYLEAECAYVGSSWSTFIDSDASNLFYVEPKSGENSRGSAPADTSSMLTFELNVDTVANFNIFGRVIAPTTNDDSFWLRANGGTWYRWNGIGNNSAWNWVQVWDSDNGNTPVSFPLDSGSNIIDIAIREDGTQLDKIFVTLESTAPLTIGVEGENCSPLSGIDTDRDGIIDDVDLDDDNDGILDLVESPATITFSDNKTLLVGSNGLADMRVGDVVVYDDAVRDCNDVFYDVTITVNFRSPGVTVEAGDQGMLINTAGANEDDYFTFTLSVVESGSATIGNPGGTSAIIEDFLFTPRDIDSNDGIDHTEVFGIRNTTAPDSTFLDDLTVLEEGGFVNGGGPGGGYTYYRMIPLSGATDWTINGNDGTGTLEEYAVFMFYENFSTVDIAYGRTGSALSNDAGTRLTSLYASKECDRDDDGVPNRIDLDLDNDGIFDLYEAGHSELDLNDDGRIDNAENASGTNGVFDNIETFPDNGVLNYTYSDSDSDEVQDFYDLDSDDDGCFDTEEADVPDGEPDGTAGSGTATADANGLVVSVVYDEPPTSTWQDATQGCLEICDNGIDDDMDGLIDEFDPDCAEYFLEAECGFAGANWNRVFDPDASNNDYSVGKAGFEALGAPPTSSDGLIRFTLSITAEGLYRILGRVRSLDGSSDSFWVRVDEGTWYEWNDWNTANLWEWIPFSDNNNGNTVLKFNLDLGIHTIDIAYREEGAQIDKLHLTINGTTPTGEGETAINCGRIVTTNLFLPYKLINK